MNTFLVETFAGINFRERQRWKSGINFRKWPKTWNFLPISRSYSFYFDELDLLAKNLSECQNWRGEKSFFTVIFIVFYF